MSAAGDQDDPFARLHALGYRLLVPVVPGVGIAPESPVYARRGKGPGLLGSDGWHGMRGWQQHEASDEDLVRWSLMGAGTGIRTGRQPDGSWLAAIDADTLHRGHALTIAAEVVHSFGSLPMRIGNAPKALFPIRLSAPLPYIQIRFADETEGGGLVEVLGENRHFVAAGIHPKTKRPYAWPDAVVAYAALPIVDPSAVEAFLARLRGALPDATGTKGAFASAKDQAALRGDPELVRRAVEAIPNTSEHFRSRQSWIAMGCAIRAAVEDEFQALDIWARWSARWVEGQNDPDEVVKNWGRIRPPFQIGASYIFDMADRLTGSSFKAASYHEEVPEPAAESLKDSGPPRFDFESFDRAADRALSDPAPFLVKGLLDLGAMSVVYGDSNSGKTFLVLDLEHCIATGRRYAGKRVRQGAVLHIFSEGARGGRKRAEALRRAHGPAPDFHMLFSSVDLFDAAADLQPLLAAIAALGFPFLLIVVDTLARAMAGGDENSTKDMSAFVRNVDRLRIVTGAHVMLIHHTGKDTARGARGSSALRAATDTEIEVAPGQVTVTKQRDLDKSWTSTFSLRVVELGRDEDGDPVTSCTVALGQDNAPVEEAAQAKQVSGAVAVLRAIKAEPKASQRRLVEMSGLTRSTVQRMLDQLKKERLIASLLGTWELTSKGEKALNGAT